MDRRATPRSLPAHYGARGARAHGFIRDRSASTGRLEYWFRLEHRFYRRVPYYVTVLIFLFYLLQLHLCYRYLVVFYLLQLHLVWL